MQTITTASMLPSAVAQVDAVLARGAWKHGDAWKTRDDYDDIIHAIAHIREYIDGVRTTDYGASPLAHAVARLLMVIERSGR